MRKLILTAAIASIGLSSTAFAADLPARAYTKAPAMMQAAYDWSGFYIGINGGGATGNVDWNEIGIGDEGSHNPSGATFGGQVGYRWQMASWVFGLEAQGNWADFRGSNISLQTGFENQTKVDAFGLFTGQIGYAWDRALFYVKGGAAVTDNRYNVYNNGFLQDNASEARWGAAVGAGFEYAIMPNLSLGFEYDHLFMGGNDVTFASATVDHIKQDVDLFTVRLNYKFGGPVMAGY
ncbi:outer membrane beta-barrel protein [Bradyrhizobium sp.]|uniref:outer membrane protein n=1 Tax=Bradyrhizobium sp. TaxID=376 RepID=UPI002619C21D|nr:outer membrane beta-barrel protein [Bradyrhizobium sp.]